MDKLLSTTQKGGESMREYIEMFCNLSLMSSTGMPLLMLLQICRHNFLDGVEIRMRAIKVHTWKEFVKQAEIAEKSAKKFKPSVPKNKWGVNTKGRDAAQSSQPKGKETMAVKLSETTQSKQKSSTNGNQNLNSHQRCTPS